MINSEIKIVFFDVGGVLLYREKQPLEIIAGHFNIELSKVRELQAQKNNDLTLAALWDGMRTIEDQHDYGVKSATWFLNHADLPVTDQNISAIADAFNVSNHRLMVGAKEIIEYLKPKYRLGIISNAMPSRKGDELTNYGLIDSFDPIVISRELGVEKPHPDIYEAALELAEVQADQAAFVDDWPQALEGAKTAGFGSTFFMDFPKGNWEHDISGSIRLDCLIDLKKYL